MNTVQSKLITTGLFFVLIFLTGFVLRQSERPLNSIVFAVHKLVAVVAVIFLAVTVYRTNQIAPLSSIELTATAITGSFFLATIVTGGLLSIDKAMPAIVHTMHQTTPLLTVLSSAWLLWRLLPVQVPVMP